MTLDILLIILGFIFMLIGIVGCIAPMLPGIPLSYIGILLLHLTSGVQFSTAFLLFWGAMVVMIQLLDYYIPIWGTKKFGGANKGAWGSTVGVVAGMFLFPPIGIIIFPFVGAVVGELIDKKDPKTALKAGFGAFLGFVTGTLMKLAVAIILTGYFIREVVRLFI